MGADPLAPVKGGDLNGLLALCTKEELDPVVTLIVGKLSSMLETDERYRLHSPDHTKYHDRIGDEIRLFGGNTVANNIGRFGKGPSYGELVGDVCWKLGVPYVRGQTVANEADLLETFFEGRWDRLTPAERERLAIGMCASGSQNGSSFGWKEWIATAGALFPGWVGATAFVSLYKRVTDPAYRITIPIVLHLAYLRRKILEEGRGGSAAVGSAAGPTDLRMAVEVPTDRVGSVVIEDELGKPVLSLTSVAAPGSDGWNPISRNSEISRLSPLLQAVPTGATVMEVATTRYMEVVCDGELVRSSSGRGYRGWSRDRFGITEQAELFDPDRLSRIVSASALMNVASIALAQKHLADISAKLSSIKDAVDEVGKFQKDKRFSDIAGSLRYLAQIAPTILAGDLPDRILHIIEGLEVDLLRLQGHLAGDTRAEIARLCQIKDKDWFGSKSLADELRGSCERVNELRQQLLLCLQARACAWQLLCVFPVDDLGIGQRRRDIAHSLEDLNVDGEQQQMIDQLTRDKIDGVSSILASGMASERKLALTRGQNEARRNLAAGRAAVLEYLKVGDGLRAARLQPFRMVLQIEQGQITAVQAT